MTEQRALVLCLDAPLMSFGGVLVDNRGVTEPFPTQSMLAGLLANALGYDHRDFDATQRLQERLRYAARRDRAGTLLTDYQTVDLGQDFLAEGWTTRGRPSGRGGGSAKTGTHIRYRRYWADAVFTVALFLDPAEEEPTLDHCAAALDQPERPLFLGRKPCIPSTPLNRGMVEATSLRHALTRVPLAGRPDPQDGPWAAWWPPTPQPDERADAGHLVPVSDERDWANQVHTGRRFVWEGRIERGELEGTVDG